MATTITAASVCIFYKGNEKVTFGALVDGGLGAIRFDLPRLTPTRLLAPCCLGKHPWALAAQAPKIEGGWLHGGGA